MKRRVRKKEIVISGVDKTRSRTKRGTALAVNGGVKRGVQRSGVQKRGVHMRGVQRRRRAEEAARREERCAERM